MTAFGRAIRHEWAVEADFVTVNHGSYGATPTCVLAVQDAWRARMEAQTSRFFNRELPGALRAAAGGLAHFLGARPEDVVFVPNATTGCNAVLRSLVLQPGDEILVLGHVYGAVRNTVRHVTGLAGAVMTEAAIAFPRPDEDALVASVVAAITARTRLAVIDHITSPSAIVLPIGRIIAACHARGVPVLVDGAHAPGHVDLDLVALDADYYTGNCHKWLNAPKGSAFLWVRADRQVGLHSTTISHGYGQGFVAEFDWTGTQDPSGYLAVPAALDFHRRLGGPALRARNAALAFEAAGMLAGRLGTETGTGNAPGGAMAVIRLPVSADALVLRQRLMEAGTDAPVSSIDGALWLRISAQAYNDMEDFVRMADILEQVLAQA
jgi:isopenicillin-N epimerase